MKNVIATTFLADPEGAGPELPPGVPVQVDDSNPTIKSYLDAGYLVPAASDGGTTQEWTPGEQGAPITTAADGSDLATSGEVQPKAKK